MITSINSRLFNGALCCLTGLFAMFAFAGPLNAGPSSGVSGINAVNVTPSGFSVVGHVSGLATARIAVYSDASATTSLAGKVGVEFYPLHTGNPELSTAYGQRQLQRMLVQKTKARNLLHMRVSQCQPGTTYYYRLFLTGTNGVESVWPTNGVLQVSTAAENAFVPQTRQLVIELPGSNVEGSLVTLSNANAAYKLAAVVGDGAKYNQVVFTLTDLIGEDQSNLDLVGNQEFTAEVMGDHDFGSASHYRFDFPAGFGVGGGAAAEPWDTVLMRLGSTVLRAGESDYVGVDLASRSALASLSFNLTIPSERLSNVAIQPIAPQIESYSITDAGHNRSLLTFMIRNGDVIYGTQQVARITFTAPAQQSSAFIPFVPENFSVTKQDTSPAANAKAQTGRVVVIAGNPLVDLTASTNQNRMLTLYGNPGSTYQMQYSSKLDDSPTWTDWTNVALSGFVQSVDALQTTNEALYFRARQISP